MSDTSSILGDPAYKASVQRIEDAIRDHHRILENFGNEHLDGDPENSIVVGWVTVIGQVGFVDGREFHSAIVEYPETLNTFHAVGLIDYARRFLANQTADYSTMDDE